MCRVAIHQPQYIPWAAYFDKILQSDIFIFLDDVHFQKNGLQNRNQIKTPQGKAWLTLPVKHSFGELINEVEISNTKSKEKHLRSLKMNYARAPYFSEVYGIVSSVLERESDYISSISIELIRKILDYLGYRGEIILSSDLDVQGKASGLILDLCVAVEAKQYLSGIGGKNYLVREDFDKSSIDVEFQKFCLPEYEQCFPKVGFIPDLSILDLLFNEGKRSKDIIKLGAQVYLD
jgi:hypothetical protein